MCASMKELHYGWLGAKSVRPRYDRFSLIPFECEYKPIDQSKRHPKKREFIE